MTAANALLPLFQRYLHSHILTHSCTCVCVCVCEYKLTRNIYEQITLLNTKEKEVTLERERKREREREKEREGDTIEDEITKYY